MMDVPDMADMENPDIPDMEVPDVSEFRLSMEEKLSKGKVLGASDGSLKEKKNGKFQSKRNYPVFKLFSHLNSLPGFNIMAQCISFFFSLYYSDNKIQLVIDKTRWNSTARSRK